MNSRLTFGVLAATTIGLLLAGDLQAQTITAPAGTVQVGSAEDYATQTFQDPWDMDKRTDLGWFTWGDDQPAVNLSGRTLSNGIFSGVPVNNDPNFWLLDTHTPGFGEFGRVGSKFPIDGTKYKVLMLRMKLASNPPGGLPAMQVLWSNNTFHTVNEDGSPRPNGGPRTGTIGGQNAGWWIHYIDLTTMGGAPGDPPWPGTSPFTVDALRIDPTNNVESGQIDLDWARLTTLNGSYQRQITWSPAATPMDIFLDTSGTCSGPNLSQIAKGVTGGSFNFYFGGLPAGDYHVGIRPSTPGTAALTCSSGFYRVAGVPTMTFTAPSEEGSSDDFATTQFGDAWDMNALSDIEYSNYVLNPAITTINGEDEAGNSLGVVQVLKGTSPAPGSAGADDPYLYPLWFGGKSSPWGTGAGKGMDYRIDTNRYRVLTFEMAVDNPTRQIAAGSHARIIWHVAGDVNGTGGAAENVSTDVILNHIGGRTGSASSPQVFPKVIMDMKATPNESDPGASPSVSGWVNGGTLRPGVDGFRIDPDEFPGGRDFFLRRIKLAAFERFESSYTIQWSYSSPTADPFTISFFYDTDNLGFNGTAIGECTDLAPATGSCNWISTGALTAGTPYDIYSQTKSGGTVVNQAYARWPVIKDSAPPLSRPRMTLDRSRLNFAGIRNGQTLTDPQQLRLTISGTGASTVGWQAVVIKQDGTPLSQFVSVSPSTGTGSAIITVSIIPSSGYPNALSGNWAIKVEETSPGSMANSPQYSRAYFQMYATTGTQPPFGSFDTPIGGTIQGSIAVTGWATDDLAIDHVEIWRDLAPGETTTPFNSPGHPGNGKVFIANAVFVEGARPDVEATYFSNPLSYRAGWGYLLLTWGLWNQGNGPFKLYAFAYDKDGYIVTLGTKSITSANASATKPFGGIDAPAYGETKSGQFLNFGWALTPNATPPCVITNGNVFVGIDSGALAPVDYGDSRTDIAGFFPGFSNGTNAGGHYFIDTTTLSNGTHQIGWFAVDSCGRSDGIGSRFFNVFNSSLVAGASAVSNVRLQSGDAVNLEPVTVWRNGDWQTIDAAASGVHVVEVKENERIELQLPEGAAYTGGQAINGTVRSLPIGSSMAGDGKTFYWQPAAGFLGAFELVFAPTGDAGLPVKVRTVVGPPLRMTIDTPSAGTVTSQPFMVAGWAIDLASAEGSGIDTVHVWAYPVTGASPTFLGVAATGEPRPDVATTYGQQFEGSSFSLIAKSLAAGTYDIIVYPHRAATNSFDGAQAVRVTIE